MIFFYKHVYELQPSAGRSTLHEQECPSEATGWKVWDGSKRSVPFQGEAYQRTLKSGLDTDIGGSYQGETEPTRWGFFWGESPV